jgi:hypothetical protein
MRAFVPMLALLTLAMPAAAHAQDRPAPACALRVQFASYAMGIDRPVFDRVQLLFKRDAGVRGVGVQRWGREGETTLCVETRRASDARRLFGRVKAMLPAKPRGPITVETQGGLRFEAPRGGERVDGARLTTPENRLQSGS